MLAPFNLTKPKTKSLSIMDLKTRKDIVIRKHARDRYRDRIRDVDDEQIDKHITQMLTNASVATLDQKRIIENTCSHDIRNNYLYNDEYEQYIFGDLVICVAFKEQLLDGECTKTRHVTTLYFL